MSEPTILDRLNHVAENTCDRYASEVAFNAAKHITALEAERDRLASACSSFEVRARDAEAQLTQANELMDDAINRFYNHEGDHVYDAMVAYRGEEL